MLGTEVNFGREPQQRLGAAIDQIACGPGHHQENRIRLQNSGAADDLFEVTRQGFLICRCSGLMRGQEMTSHDADPERFRLIARNEIIDMPAGTKQINPLRGKVPNFASVHGDLYEQISNHKMQMVKA